ncbi:aldehyde dehydrogenase family protein [Rhodococcus sp. PAMC28707]|uniref:aldehyde dehydrogenase family protein n=1 Tax=unclassified Rhodococcus (in: high G+C Gram-positive bacteria) TaxID=192944 RepID=UPI00109E246F|nr:MULTISPECIES: aldehyde dehydrogenase family protein [unclassified Rhodococcus (in: high G+C Gram-positive bacteria)]QCB49646.1 aldehyde dehydrogenase family protein [Rhodococcus sp. PAMC28705]QCB58663.1 aldehyde dehydrogenase family protein [Rhodococcus sp. PAMC28707]
MTRQTSTVQGSTVPTSKSTSFDSVSPIDDRHIGTFDKASAESVAAVVAEARRVELEWSSLPPRSRIRHLRAWRHEIWSRRTEFIDLIHRENGKPAEDALLEIVLTLEHIAWAEGHAPRLLRTRRVNPGLLLANYSARVDKVALGVVGVIGPWNYPLYAPNSAISSALAAGNCVVFKPSEYTPAVGARYVQAFHDANPTLPTGVLSLVTGFGDTGAALCRSGVDKIAFTGSTSTGSKIMTTCAETLTPVVMECGGKDPVIVAADADVAAAAEAVAWGAFTNGGQTCIGVERVYVERSVSDEFIAGLVEHARRIRPGGDASATYGPMTMPAQIEIVRGHLEDAAAAGGRALIGGLDSIGPRFIGPTVLVDTPEDCSAVREETFGPTVTVCEVDDLDEAIRRANDHRYALGASVFSRRRGQEIAVRLVCGQVTVNSVIAFAGMGSVPMGGVGASGFGRVHGDEGFAEFCRTRSRVSKMFDIPGFELVTLRRKRWVAQLIDRLLWIRHRA